MENPLQEVSQVSITLVDIGVQVDLLALVVVVMVVAQP